MQLHREEPRIREKGASLQLVGIGAPAVIRAFRDETGVTAPIFADPTFATYRALGMRRGLGTFLSLSLLRHAIRALRAGYRNRSIQGDAMQHGGVLVVRPGGEVAYRYISKTAGDHPPVKEVLGAL
ncbi:MAG: peroxiredoxin-like family protein [Thermoanaerobaculia bacterium]